MTNTAVDRKGSAKGLAIREFPLQRTRNIGIMAHIDAGKTTTTERIVYSALEQCRRKTGNDPVTTLKRAVENVRPVLETKSRRVGGATYQVPVEVRQGRSTTLALRWLVSFARKRGERGMVARLAGEIMDAANNTGASIRQKEDLHRMAEANRAFAHYRW